MRSLRAFTAVLAGLTLVSGSAHAQGVPLDAGVAQADWAAIASCLQESGRTPRACIGAVAVICATRQAAGDRAQVEAACSRREAAVWRERLDRAVALLLERLDPAGRNRLLGIQRGWEDYVPQRCLSLAGEIDPAGAPIAMQAECELRHVATRAIEIERLAQSPNPGSALTR